MAVNLGERYARALRQLLPKGVAWQQDGCNQSLLARWMRGSSEELARFQVWFDTLLKYSIERYGELPTGWSADEYEALILRKFGLTVTVQPSTAPDNPHMPEVTDRNRYRFVIEVHDWDDLIKIDELFRTYLHEYKQSHTDFWVKAPTQSAAMPTAPANALLVKHKEPERRLKAKAATALAWGVGLFMHGRLDDMPLHAVFASRSEVSGIGLFMHGRQDDTPIRSVLDNEAGSSSLGMFAHATITG